MNQNLLFIGKKDYFGEIALYHTGKTNLLILEAWALQLTYRGHLESFLLLLKIGSKFSRVPGSSLFSKFPSPSRVTQKAANFRVGQALLALFACLYV
jgi:hypothetical protein